ncbi:MAG TPA: 16S rRNA (guanine(527)-N(7))-methyltransferase RsmG [Gammaproteobacteria bacterium]|jgi:16S rRNA (guanine527-N7)-methyltransferase|nr:16S rRNA (guanine(527)-N(7))-methyltransferase RsmG [Gammaproteobacteria bacterium]
MNKQKEFLHQLLVKNHLLIAPLFEEKFLNYLELMLSWNRVFNLTSITDPKDMVLLHILDSLSISPYLVGDRIIDVGTGAGLPGIPLAILHPEKHFVLLDSNHKKTRFLTQAVLELKLPNVEIVTERVEKFHPTTLFHCILSRAFASLSTMLTETHHLLAENGVFLAMKGMYPEKELMDIPPQFIVRKIHRLTINGLTAERHLVCMEKTH